MKDQESHTPAVRKPYVPPAIERVVLDPIKEMLVACPENLGGKLGGTCTQNFS